VIQPRNVTRCESLCTYNCRGSTGLLYAPGRIGLAGVLERGRCEGGLPRNLGELAVSIPERTGGGGTGGTTPWPVASKRLRSGGRCGSTTRTSRAQGVNGIAKRRERSAARRAVSSLSVPIVPWKRGNSPDGPCGGKGDIGS